MLGLGLHLHLEDITLENFKGLFKVTKETGSGSIKLSTSRALLDPGLVNLGTIKESLDIKHENDEIYEAYYYPTI